MPFFKRDALNQIDENVRQRELRKRARRRGTGRGQGNRNSETTLFRGYIFHGSTDSLVTNVAASALRTTTHNVAWFVMSGTVDASPKITPPTETEDVWQLQYNGNPTGNLNVNITAAELVTELEALPGLNAGEVLVEAFPGRYLVDLTNADIELLLPGTSDVSIYRQTVDWWRVGNAMVRPIHIEENGVVSAGNFASGPGGQRVLPECRQFDFIGLGAGEEFPSPDNPGGGVPAPPP